MTSKAFRGPLEIYFHRKGVSCPLHLLSQHTSMPKFKSGVSTVGGEEEAKTIGDRSLLQLCMDYVDLIVNDAEYQVFLPSLSYESISSHSGPRRS